MAIHFGITTRLTNIPSELTQVFTQDRRGYGIQTSGFGVHKEVNAEGYRDGNDVVIRTSVPKYDSYTNALLCMGVLLRLADGAAEKDKNPDLFNVLLKFIDKAFEPPKQ